MYILLSTFAVVAIASAIMLLLAIALGGPRIPAPVASINEPFNQVDFSTLPPISRFDARDNQSLAYRVYTSWQEEVRGSVVLIHGSAASGGTMHPMAMGFADAGYEVYALDLRGHGDSGERGHIDYVGQLENDLEDFLQAVQPCSPCTLVGFSAGGGFALRIAGASDVTHFDNFVLLASFLSWQASTQRESSGGWVNVGKLRFAAIEFCNRFGLKIFNRLTVINFALNDTGKKLLTPQYSFNLAKNFLSDHDYRASMRGVDKPTSVLAGLDDEVFVAHRFMDEFHSTKFILPVVLLRGITHVTLTLSTRAIQEAVDCVDRMNYFHGPQASSMFLGAPVADIEDQPEPVEPDSEPEPDPIKPRPSEIPQPDPPPQRSPSEPSPRPPDPAAEIPPTEPPDPELPPTEPPSPGPPGPEIGFNGAGSVHGLNC